jgi:hypothetical protein
VKKQGVSAARKKTSFRASPQFRLKCNRYLKLSYKRLLKTLATEHVAVEFLPLKRRALKGRQCCFIDDGNGNDASHPMQQASSFPDRETVASKLTSLTSEDKAWVLLLMENALQDENLLGGLNLYLDQQTNARFLNSLKLETTGEWLGGNAPSRLQIRITETARASQHPAYIAFRKGLTASAGLEKAYPKAPI